MSPSEKAAIRVECSRRINRAAEQLANAQIAWGRDPSDDNRIALLRARENHRTTLADVQVIRESLRYPSVYPMERE